MMAKVSPGDLDQPRRPLGREQGRSSLHAERSRAGVSSPALRIWEIASGKQVASLPLGMEFIQNKDSCPRPDSRNVAPLEAPSGNVELAKAAITWKTNPIETDRSEQHSPDGRWRATKDADSIMLQYEGGRTVTLPHFDNVYEMAFTADGMSLVTTSANGDARVWALSREGMIRASCARLTSNFSKIDWRKFLPDEPYRAICPELPEPAP